jgi:hypothetical protein
VPEPTDPANARLALRRLLRNLVLTSSTGTRDAVDLDTFDGVLSALDSDEIADYEQVATALEGIGPARFAVVNWNGWALLDLGTATDPHGPGEALVVIAGEEKIVRALAVVLNADPDALDRQFLLVDEPF